MNVQQWQHYIEEKIGFILPKAQLQWLVNAIEQTANAHNLSLAQLWLSIKVDDKLRQQLLDAVLIPESRFFRHMPSIQFISALAVQEQQPASALLTPPSSAIKALSKDKYQPDVAPFRIWSVGCATGQEVWSLAMSLAEQKVAHYHILGTDVSQQALTKARLGRYTERECQTIAPIYQKFMPPVSGTEYPKPSAPSADTDRITSAVNGVALSRSTSEVMISRHQSQLNAKLRVSMLQPQRQVVPMLRRQVRFIWHNIFTKDMPVLPLQNVIICQNMLIYFRQFDQRDILTRLAAQCELGGYIVLAPGEALFWRPSNMRRIAHPQVNAWQKISA